MGHAEAQVGQVTCAFLLYRDRQRLTLLIKDLGSFGRTRVLRLMDAHHLTR